MGGFFGSAPKETALLQVVLSSGGTAKEFVEDSGFGAGAAVHRGDDVLVQQVSYSSNAHELVHLVSHFWLPRQPRWIAEGFAEYLGDAEFKRDAVIRMGRWQWGGWAR